MAQAKKRLGRGLGNLISGGATPAKKAAPPPAKKTPAKKAAAKKPAPKKTPVKKSAPATAEKPAAEVPAAKVPVGALEGFEEVAVGSIVPNPYQPRREIEPEALRALAESIRSEGLLQPIVVRRRADGFELIAGERRWRACQSLGLKKIPARVVEASDTTSAVVSLVENLQREGLNPVEEAQGYASLLRDFDLTQETVAERLGKSRTVITNSLRLLRLPSEVLGLLATGHLSTGHAKVLLGLEDETQIVLLARRVVEGQLSVRQLEGLVKARKSGHAPAGGESPRPAAERAAVADVEKRLSSHLSAGVSVRHGAKKGRLVIEYRGNEDLQRILGRMGIEL